MSAHCEHCAEQCNAEDPIGWSVLGIHTDSDYDTGAEWPEGRCPACAEREQIIEFLAALIAVADDEARTTASDTVRHRAQGASDILGWIIGKISSGQHTNGGDT